MAVKIGDTITVEGVVTRTCDDGGTSDVWVGDEAYVDDLKIKLLDFLDDDFDMCDHEVTVRVTVEVIKIEDGARANIEHAKRDELRKARRAYKDQHGEWPPSWWMPRP